MKKKEILVTLLFVILFKVNTFGQSRNEIVKLTAKEFSLKMKEYPTAPIIDVRTSDEFVGGHLKKAINFDWYGSNFKNQITTLEKSKPVFIYCHSGNRSGRAVGQMRAAGFTKIYELKDGMIGWQSAGMPIIK